MNIKVLGTGCTNCKNLEKAVNLAVSEMKMEANIEKVEDIQKIMSYGIMRTPGLVINEKVVSYGKVLSVSEVKELINKYN